MSMFGTDRDVDAIAEYADSSVRVMSRRGSLAPISGRHGFNEWLYTKWGNSGNAIYTFTGGLLTAFSGIVMAATGFSDAAMWLNMPGMSILLVWSVTVGFLMRRAGKV